MTANWIRTRRQQLRLSQEQLATRLQIEGIDIQRAAISHWETGRHSPRVDDPKLVEALARVLQMTVREVLESIKGYQIDTTPHTRAGQRAAYIVDRLSPDKQALALGILEEISKST